MNNSRGTLIRPPHLNGDGKGCGNGGPSSWASADKTGQGAWIGSGGLGRSGWPSGTGTARSHLASGTSLRRPHSSPGPPRFPDSWPTTGVTGCHEETMPPAPGRGQAHHCAEEGKGAVTGGGGLRARRPGKQPSSLQGFASIMVAVTGRKKRSKPVTAPGKDSAEGINGGGPSRRPRPRRGGSRPGGMRSSAADPEGVNRFWRFGEIPPGERDL